MSALNSSFSRATMTSMRLSTRADACHVFRPKRLAASSSAKSKIARACSPTTRRAAINFMASFIIFIFWADFGGPWCAHASHMTSGSAEYASNSSQLSSGRVILLGSSLQPSSTPSQVTMVNSAFRWTQLSPGLKSRSSVKLVSDIFLVRFDQGRRILFRDWWVLAHTFSNIRESLSSIR